MNVWFHPPAIFNRRHVLRTAGLILLSVALTTTLFFPLVTRAIPNTTKTINFQGRLQTAAGAVVADGHYNIQFKIYQDGSGTVANNPDGTLKWTETYINNGGTAGVEVKNGFMSVNLGSINSFGTSIDWDQDTLWLSMNVAGNATGCTTFGSSPCVADGEMLPMKRITATPYSINSGQLGGKTADNFVQLGQGVQSDATTNSSIFINKTNTGNLIQLQNTASDIFTVGNAGDIILGSNANKTISVASAASNTAGNSLSILAGNGGSGTGSTGGDLVLQSGAGAGTNGNAGNITLDTGASTGTGNGGAIAIGTVNAGSITIGSTTAAVSQTISIGANNTSGSVSNVTIGAGGSTTSGTTTIQAKNAVTISTNGITRATFSDSSNTVYLGNGESSSAPNDFTIQGTNSTSSSLGGGTLNLQGGNATAGNTNGGDVVLSGGTGNGSGTTGLVVLNTPTFSTATSDANCYTSGAVVASSCTITSASVNNSAAIVIGFSTTGQTATLPDPINTTAGRIMYIVAATTSENFNLSINGGGAANLIAMHQNTTATMMWNGSDWTLAGTSSTSALQDVRDSVSGTRSVRVSNGDSNTTLLTLDKASSAPTITDSALLGSMYYDTTVGKLQCLEATGWGSCGSSPDNFITISPEYSNAVVHSTGIGTISSDLCSDTLNINDGTSSQPTICGTHETYNFYGWTSAETSAQTRSIYVTYQLPSTFKNFVAGGTSLLGRTDSSDSAVTYQIYRNPTGSALTACGSAVSVSTGSQSTWQKAIATSTADPSTCSFAPGDSIVFKINLTSQDDAHAYVSNLAFAFSNN